MNLKNTHPWIYKSFKEKDYHTVQLSDWYWAGLWADLIIEQVMIHSLKRTGGITRAREKTRWKNEILLGL